MIYSKLLYRVFVDFILYNATNTRYILKNICKLYVTKSGPGSSVGIATGYGPGIESRWKRDFPYLSRPELGPTQPPVEWVKSLFEGVKCGRGVLLTTHSLLVSW